MLSLLGYVCGVLIALPGAIWKISCACAGVARDWLLSLVGLFLLGLGHILLWFALRLARRQLEALVGIKPAFVGLPAPKVRDILSN